MVRQCVWRTSTMHLALSHPTDAGAADLLVTERKLRLDPPRNRTKVSTDSPVGQAEGRGYWRSVQRRRGLTDAPPTHNQTCNSCQA